MAQLVMRFMDRLWAVVAVVCGAIGVSVYGIFVETGRLSIFLGKTIRAGVTGRYEVGKWIQQFIDIGYFSLPVVGLTTIFSGMVLALQSADRFEGEIAAIGIPNLIVLAITRELAPVLAGLMVAGRIGAAMAAEIGSMRVTEQIDALVTLKVDPLRHLVFPRVLAATLALPLLVLAGDFLGIFGGWLITSVKLGLPNYLFFEYGAQSFNYIGVASGLLKAAVFGLIVAVNGCYQGYYARGGALGVGRVTTRAVVFSSIEILIANYIITVWIFT